ncbi:MAG TPA: peptide deformylase [Polyangiaceae bacterium]|nr:peptide deformylase [Polyangiaceae bacterium]
MPFDLDAWVVGSASPSPIVRAGAAVLRHRAHDVPRALIGSPALMRLVDVMVETMRSAPGVGLAAPQIGVPLRVFVAEDTYERMQHVSEEARIDRGRTPLPLTVLVNPTVSAAAGGGRATFFEGCLSVPGYAALVRRATTVAVAGLDARGAPVARTFEGWPARIMQHEMDHLDGTLYVDRMISRSLASDAEMARLAALPVADVLRELVDP